MILIGIPAYDNTVHTGILSALVNEARLPDTPRFTLATVPSSALCFSHNALLCVALNARPTITHYLNLHADIVPQTRGWLRILTGEMDRTGADVLSVVAPLKDHTGTTSTALMSDKHAPVIGIDAKRHRRVTLKELPDLPKTFGAEHVARLFGEDERKAQLLVNTGCMLLNLKRTAFESLYFETRDTIWRNADGQFVPHFEPEDWHFSRECARAGLRVMATRAVQVKHAGRMEYPSWGEWGGTEHDVIQAEQPLQELAA